MNLYNDWDELKDAFYEMFYSLCESCERGLFDWNEMISELYDEGEEILYPDEKLWNFFLEDNRVRTPFDDYDVGMDEEYAMNHEYDEECWKDLEYKIRNGYYDDCVGFNDWDEYNKECSYATKEDCKTTYKEKKKDEMKNNKKKEKIIRPINVYLITNCIDDAYVFTSKIKADKKIKEFPNYTVYEWIDLTRYHYEDVVIHPEQVAWKRPCKRTEFGTEFDDTKTPWKMLLLAKDKTQWTANRKNFDSIRYAMEKFGDRKYYKIQGEDIPMETKSKGNSNSIWIDGGTNFIGLFDAEITDREWLENYKKQLHPDDEWTNVNLETYGKWIRRFNHKEASELVNEALKVGVVGYLD